MDILCVTITFYEYCFKANLMWSVVQKVEAIPYMAWVGFTSPQLSKFPFFHGWLKKNHYVDELHLNHYYLYLLNILLVPLVHNKGASDPQLGNAACDHTWPRPMARPIINKDKNSITWLSFKLQPFWEIIQNLRMNGRKITILLIWRQLSSVDSCFEVDSSHPTNIDRSWIPSQSYRHQPVNYFYYHGLIQTQMYVLT